MHAAATPDGQAPSRDRLQLIVFFAGLLVTYLATVVVIGPDPGGDADRSMSRLAPGVMFAPTVGALAAVVLAGGHIQFGRLRRRWLLAGLVPSLAVLATTLLVAFAGGVDLHAGELPLALILLPVFAIFGAITAIGEEIGWRGFLWPLLRRRQTFIVAAATMFVIWLAYHLPLTIAGYYGFTGGIPAFCVALVGFVLFAGVVTERSASIWPSVVAHGAWNASVAVGFSASGSDDENRAFTGSRVLLGEFGWIAAVTMLALGVATAAWHLRTPPPAHETPEPAGAIA